MTVEELQRFAAAWEAAWNSHDLERILSHYQDDIVFRSRKAEALVGTGHICGKQALRHYWRKALDSQPDLHFRVQGVFIGVDMLVISYNNHQGVRAAETLCFGTAGLVREASACHAAE